MLDLTTIIGFQWGEGDTQKNERHDVSIGEAEQVFFNTPLLVLPDQRHGGTEPCFHALGKTHDGLCLHITFTIKDAGELIRVVSARDMLRKERLIYEQTT